MRKRKWMRMHVLTDDERVRGNLMGEELQQSTESVPVERIADCTCRRGELVLPDSNCPNKRLHWRHQ